MAIGVAPKFFGDGDTVLTSFWDSPGAKQVTATCGSGQPKSLSIIVLPNTEEEVEVADKMRDRAKRNAAEVSIGFNDSAAVLGILGGAAALASLPVSAGLLAVAAGANWYYGNRWS